MTTKTLLFESVTCSRCAGSGMYGPRVVYGGRCFKCHGRGVVLTRRGCAAQAFFTALCSKKASDIVVGDSILYEGFSAGSFSQPSRWDRVVAVRPSDVGIVVDGQEVTGQIAIETDGGSWHLNPTGVVRVRQDKASRAAKVAEALAYQDTLTKLGKVRARRASRPVLPVLNDAVSL